jgi:hypothetical protein
MAASAAMNIVRTRKTDPSPHPGPIQDAGSAEVNAI